MDHLFIFVDLAQDMNFKSAKKYRRKKKVSMQPLAKMLFPEQYWRAVHVSIETVRVIPFAK